MMVIMTATVNEANALLRRRHLHALLDTPLEAPGLQRMKMETRTVEGPKGTPPDPRPCSVCRALVLPATVLLHSAGTCRRGLPTKGSMHAMLRAGRGLSALPRHRRDASPGSVVLMVLCLARAGRPRLEPTWRVAPGECRDSLALEVAASCRLPQAILQRAAEHYQVRASPGWASSQARKLFCLAVSVLLSSRSEPPGLPCELIATTASTRHGVRQR